MSKFESYAYTSHIGELNFLKMPTNNGNLFVMNDTQYRIFYDDSLTPGEIQQNNNPLYCQVSMDECGRNTLRMVFDVDRPDIGASTPGGSIYVRDLGDDLYEFGGDNLWGDGIGWSQFPKFSLIDGVHTLDELGNHIKVWMESVNQAVES